MLLDVTKIFILFLKGCPKMISPEKLKIWTPLQKMPKNVGDLGKLIVAIGFEKLPKVQQIVQSGHTGCFFLQHEQKNWTYVRSPKWHLTLLKRYRGPFLKKLWSQSKTLKV